MVKFHFDCRTSINWDRHSIVFPAIARHARNLQRHLATSCPGVARIVTKMAKIFILIAFLPHLFSAMVQREPSPCSEYFTYMTKPGITDLLGQIEIPSPSENNTFFLKVALDTATEWPVVRLELAQSIKASVGRVHQGRPLLYHVYYPIHEPIPSLSAIWFNNRRYCPGPEVNGNITANLELGHILYPPNEEPLMYNDGPWQQIAQPWHRNISHYRIDNPSYDRLHNEECGITNYYTDDTNRLIPDLELTLPGQWPWLVAIHSTSRPLPFFGSGSILTTRHVITAMAYGLPGDIDDLYVSFGQLNSSTWHVQNHMGVVHRGVADYKISSNTSDEKLVILILKTAVEFNAFIRPVCLWSGSTNLEDVVNMTGYIVGWGYKDFKYPPFYGYDTSHQPPYKSYTEEPRTVKVPLMNLSEHSGDEIHKVLIVPAEHLNYDRPCDLGGGLVVFNITTGRYQLRGVAFHCHPVSTNMLYIDVANHLPWIREQISII